MITRVLATATVIIASVATLSAEPIPDEFRQNGFAVGCQTYTFNRYTLFEAIEKTAEAGGKIVEVYPGQKLSKEQPDKVWNHDATDEMIAQVQEKLKEHKIKVVNYGVVTGKDEAEWRKIFEFGKKLGLYAITTEDALKLDIIEPLVKEFDIKLAIHNHPRRLKDENYKVWDPHYVLSVVKDRDPRIGACADTGHWQTSGINPVYGLRVLKGRIISLHLKDKEDFGESHNVVFGTGVGEIGKCLKELREQKLEGNISIEHEHNWTTNVPEVKASIDFVREFKDGQ